MSKKDFIILFLITGIAFILSLLSIRICPFFNIFKIPCPGCGLTRSFKYLLKGQIITSLNYNILGIIIPIIILIYLIFIIFGKKKKIDYFIKKHQKVFIILAIILTAITWILNLHNPNLY